MTRIFRGLLGLLVLFAAALFPAGNASAQSNALSITPRKDYNLKAGESVSDNITLTNLNRTQPLVVRLELIDFRAENESGTPQLLQEQNAQPTPWSIKDFVTLPQQVTVDGGKSTQIPITVNIPKNLGAGSYYSALQYAVVADQGNGEQLTVAASGVTLIFVNVPGVARELLKFEQFGAFVPTPDGSSGNFSSLFVSSKPKVLAFRLTNQGNIAEVPSGTITIKGFTGKTVIDIPDANPKRQIALLGQTRRFETCINPQVEKVQGSTGVEVDQVLCKDPKLSPGRYSAELKLLYGSNGNETREITSTASFWYLPFWFIAVMLVVIGIIAAIVFFIVRRIQHMRDVRSRRRRR
jgi:hypothetical protein